MTVDSRFRPAHRLGQTIGFKAIFANRRVLRGKVFDLHYAINDIGTARFGVVIPKRNIRRAVQRNLFKRLAREVFRQQRASLPGIDLVLRLARTPPKDMMENPLLRQEIVRLLARLPAGVV